MFLEIMIAIACGVTAGVFTGLIPGIHVNLISVILISSSGYLLGFVSLEFLIAFIIAMAVTHTFLDTIPSIFLGAPDGATALSVLPGHRLLLEGKGLEAVKLTIIGSLLGLLISASCYYFLEFVIKTIYPVVQNYIGELLFAVSLFIIFNNNKFFRTLIVFSFAGVLGLMVLNARLENSLFPMLSGFFGVSTLIFSLKNNSKIPKQEYTDKTDLVFRKGVFSAITGTLSGFITAVLPGIGASTAAAIGSLIKKDSDARNFLVMIGSISTVNFFMSIAALNVLGKARNGAIIAVKTLFETPNILLLIFSALISGGIAVFLGIRISKIFIKMIEKINYELLVKFIVLLLIILTYFLSGFTGLFVLFIAFSIGYYANVKGVPRNSMMACIMIPVMVYFL